MNIALGALIISILLLPGAFILRAYYTSFKQKDKDLHIPFTELLLRGLIYSLFVHFLAIELLTFFGISVDFQLLYQIIIGDKLVLNNEHFNKSFIQFGKYNVWIITALYFGVKFIKYIIITLNWDIKFNSLRTSNFWFYVFSARYIDANRPGEKEVTDLIFVDLLSDHDIVYSGFLYDFEYSPGKDEMEIIILSNATKRTYQKTQKENLSESANDLEKTIGDHSLKLSKPVFIPGDAFLLLAKNIVNINIYYLSLGGQLVATDSLSKSSVIISSK